MAAGDGRSEEGAFVGVFGMARRSSLGIRGPSQMVREAARACRGGLLTSTITLRASRAASKRIEADAG
jgi:hypothetical protein